MHDALRILEVPFGRGAFLDLDEAEKEKNTLVSENGESHARAGAAPVTQTGHKNTGGMTGDIARESYSNGAIRFLRAVAIARLDDVRATVGVVHFLHHETVEIAVDLDARTPRVGHVADAFPPGHCQLKEKTEWTLVGQSASTQATGGQQSKAPLFHVQGARVTHSVP